MKAKMILLYGLTTLVAGCIPVLSLQPLFTEQTLVFDEHLLGLWVNDPNQMITSWEFTHLQPADQNMLPEALKDQRERVYRLKVHDKDDHRGAFIACLVKLEGGLFLDVFPASFPSGQTDEEEMPLMYNCFLFVPGHTFVKVEATADTLKMRLTDDDKFKELTDAEPNAVQFESVDDRPILTASTKDLQAFVTKHANDQRLFSEEAVLKRKAAN
jgi:hypothetical protein